MGWNALLGFSQRAPSTTAVHHPAKFKRFLFRKQCRISYCVKNRIDRWYNPKRQTSLDHVEIVRQWVQASDSSLLSMSQERFMVVSYNILGDRNASKHRDMYLHVPSRYMNWDWRKRLICEELIERNPDIICLQEVDKYYDLLNIMEKDGYDGTYKRRTGDAVDGCATFWKKNRFRLLESESIVFKEFGLRDNVAQLSVLEMGKDDSRRVLIGNIHVLFRPSRGEIKLGQIRLLLSKAHALSKKWADVPVVLAGDFNITPQSAVYQFLSTSELDIMFHDKRYLSGQRAYPSQPGGIQGQTRKTFTLIDRFLNYYWTDEEVKTATGHSDCTTIQHPLKLNSSYASVKGSTRTRDSYGEPLATTFHSKFLGTVDYLWYSDGVVPTRILDTPPIDVLRATCGLPHKSLGSDHLALVSEFAFTGCKGRGMQKK